MTKLREDSHLSGVIGNKWPCCKRPTQWHNMEQYADGQIIEKSCPKDSRRWRVTFKITQPWASMKPLLKLEWEEQGGRQ
jgi:hypothetical protein